MSFPLLLCFILMALPKQPHAPATKYEPELMFMQLTWGIIMLDIYTTHSLLLAQCTVVAPCLWTGQTEIEGNKCATESMDILGSA